MQYKLILKSTIITLLMPGSGILLIPYFILYLSATIAWPSLSVSTIFAGGLALVSFVILLYCIWGFAVHGHGTLAPIDPPKILIIRGPYRITRNPMYLAIVIILLSEAWIFRSSSLLIYAAVAFLGFHLFVILYEEPQLQAQFGTQYDEYSQKVPRWGITIRPYKI